MWVGRCFSPEALAAIKHLPVICSGSTLGSYPAIRFYINKMLTSMDSVQCWKKGIESDQGYQNYLFHNGLFNTPEGNATMNPQGYGVVNTIGAMNGFRVPKDQKVCGIDGGVPSFMLIACVIAHPLVTHVVCLALHNQHVFDIGTSGYILEDS